MTSTLSDNGTQSTDNKNIKDASYIETTKQALNSSIANVFGTLSSFYDSIPPEYQKWIELIPSFFMIAGACMPYIPQYLTIRRNRSHKGFSTFGKFLALLAYKYYVTINQLTIVYFQKVCLTLLVANILRIAFYIGHKFDETLLVQSAVMILFQLLLLELCVRVSKSQKLYSGRKRTIFNCDVRYFWRWTEVTSYIVFICIFAFLSMSLAYFFRMYSTFIEIIGFLALMTESLLALPQAIENLKNGSIDGMSIGMVLMWLLGDLYKTGYFILKHQPIQFLVCGMVQVTLDIIILLQVLIYRKHK